MSICVATLRCSLLLVYEPERIATNHETLSSKGEKCCVLQSRSNPPRQAITSVKFPNSNAQALRTTFSLRYLLRVLCKALIVLTSLKLKLLHCRWCCRQKNFEVAGNREIVIFGTNRRRKAFTVTKHFMISTLARAWRSSSSDSKYESVSPQTTVSRIPKDYYESAAIRLHSFKRFHPRQNLVKTSLHQHGKLSTNE